MRKVRLYIPNVLLTFLLVFLIIGGEAAMLVSRMVLNEKTYGVLTEQQQLDAKGYEDLTSYFRTRANSTGIPENVILDAFTQDDLKDAIILNSQDAVAYLNGSKAEFEPNADFTKLEVSIRSFFESYADENGFEKDAVFEEKLQSAISEAEARLLTAADPFKFAALRENGWLAKLRTYAGYVNPAAMVCIAAAAILIVLMILCNKNQEEHLCYWIGLASLTAGLLITAPCIYLTATDFFASFTIKDPQIYAAVVGFLRLLISRGMTMAVVTAIVGAIGIIGFIFLRAVQREEEA